MKRIPVPIDADTYARALARAGSAEALSARIATYVTRYAQHQGNQSYGGRAAAEKLTPAERSARGKKAVAARWARAKAAAPVTEEVGVPE